MFICREQKNEDSPTAVEARPHHHPAYHPSKKRDEIEMGTPQHTTNGSGPTQSNSFTAISDVPIGNSNFPSKHFQPLTYTQCKKLLQNAITILQKNQHFLCQINVDLTEIFERDRVFSTFPLCDI